MNKKIVYNFFYLVAVFLLIAWISVTIKQLHNWGGWLLILFFFGLAVAFRGNKFLKGLSYTVMILVATFLHNFSGFFFGYWSARLMKFNESDSRTISLEVGIQNAGLATGLALTMGKIATAGLAPAIFGPVMKVNGSSLASWWHNHSPKEDAPEEENPFEQKEAAKANVM